MRRSHNVTFHLGPKDADIIDGLRKEQIRRLQAGCRSRDASDSAILRDALRAYLLPNQAKQPKTAHEDSV